MDTKDVDQNLLFALAALKMGLIDHEALVKALNAWSARKDRPVGEILLAHQALPEARLFLVEQTFAGLLDSSGGDPHQGAVSLRLPAELLETSRDRLTDPDLRAALRRLESAEVGGQPITPGDREFMTTAFDPQLAAGSSDSESTQLGGPGSTLPPGATERVLADAAAAAETGTDLGAGPTATIGPGSGPDTGLAPTDAFTTRMFHAANETTEAGAETDPSRTAAFPAREAVDGPGLATTALDVPSPAPATSRAGKANGKDKTSVIRYRSLRPLAKGGLGEVFVAIDEELGREVALKEIQGRHLNHPESRARFLIEAEVTGGLEHPGIVPVYGLGQYPDGRPYYAMRFIRGKTLKEAIDAYHDRAGRGRTPGEETLELRALLNRIIDVCNAMSYAHARGILHRDIKPANIMVGGFGETLVVDWGLAKTLDHPEKERPSDPGLRPLRPLSAGASGTGTMYGTTVGTPAFMSPEQAAGELDRLGPPSDVYSIGATLYCILTGRPPFHEPHIALLLNKVRQGKFPRPRAVNRKVAPALDAICMKSMALKQEDRYLTARALADDLEHWLADEPVSVYREPWHARLARWARRHKTLVTASAALVLTALVALSIGTVLIQREQARTEANFRLARDAVDEMLTRLGEVELADVPQMEPVRRVMLAKALDFYQKFLAERGNDRSVRHETGRASLRRGDIEEMLGDYAAAEEAYTRAIAVLGALAARQPAVADYRRDLASAQHKLGVLLKKSNRFTEAESALKEAERLRQQIMAAQPNDPDALRDAMDTVYQRGTVLARLGRVKEVAPAYAAAVDAERVLTAAHPDRPDYPRKLGRYLNNRGILLRSTSSDPRTAESSFREALALQKPLAEKSPTVAGLQWERARTTSNLAGTLLDTQGAEQAAPVYREALAQLKRLADDFPSVPDYQNELAVVSFNLASALIKEAEQTKDKVAQAEIFKEASGRLEESVGIYRRLIQPERFPHRPDFRQKLALAERKRGILLDRTGEYEQAAGAFQAAIKALRELDASYPQVPEYQSDLGVAFQNLAYHQIGRQQMAEARRSLEDAIAHQRAAFESNRGNRYYVQYLLEAYADVEDALRALHDHAAAAAAADALARLLPDEPRAGYRSARLLDLSASLVASAADLPAAQRKTLSEDRAALALERLQKAVNDGVKLLPQDLGPPAFEAIRTHSPARLDALQKTLDARVNPRVG